MLSWLFISRSRTFRTFAFWELVALILHDSLSLVENKGILRLGALYSAQIELLDGLSNLVVVVFNSH